MEISLDFAFLNLDLTLMLQDWFQKNSEFDYFLVSKTENIYYFSQFWGSFGWLLISKDGKKTLITDGRYAETAQRLDCAFRLFNADFTAKFGKSITRKVACEESLTLGSLEKLKKYFPKADFAPQKNIIETLRRVKNDTEIGAIEAAQDHVDNVLLPFLKVHLKAGITEQSLNFKLQQVLQSEGKFGLSFPSIIAFGENSSRPHHVSGERRLRLGDNILIDCGTTHNHYCSDMTRNFVFGESSAKYIAKYEMLLTAQQATNAKITAGASSQAVDQFCRDALGPEAPYFTHSLGHGVGLEIHELPNLSQRSDFTLQTNEVVTNEPGLYYPGEFGIRIEDLVLVTDDHPRILSRFPKDLLSFSEDGHVQILVKAA